MFISEVMTRQVQCVSPDQTLEEAARIMADHDVGSVPVAQGDRPVGMITDRDIVVRALAAGRDLKSTRVGDVMTPEVVCCQEDDSLEDAAAIMEKHQVRRLLVTDEDDCVCGIVSIGDLAVRTDDQMLVEEVLEEVSWPGHTTGGGRRSLFSPRPHPRKMRGTSSGANVALMAGAAFLAGAVTMYALDPDRGRRRRALLRDKVIHGVRLTRDRVGKAARYARGKSAGLINETRAMLRHEEVSDPQLRERVRSVLGRLVSHPHAVTVECDDGVVYLTGPILAREIPQLISGVLKVRGVRQVRNNLEPHQRSDVPSLQGRARNSGRACALRENWSPMTRMFGIVGGGSLAAYGAVKRDALSLTLAAAGLALATRALTNISTRRLLGIGAGRRAVDVHKDININAPVEQVFDFFSKYRNFPRFMSRVLDVRDHGNGRSHWVVKGPVGMHISWDADVTALEPEQIIAWRSVPGSMVENAGIIRFEPNENGGTRVNIKISYNPPGGALGHAMAMLFGADAKSELDADLLRVKTLIETGHPAHDAARPAWS